MDVEELPNEARSPAYLSHVSRPNELESSQLCIVSFNLHIFLKMGIRRQPLR